MHNRFTSRTAALVIALLAAATAAHAAAITYQGRLTNGAQAADGEYDFLFVLYNAETGGSQIGIGLSVEDVLVEQGLFTTQLDFGPDAFGADPRWVQISVRPGASSGSYVTLTPRQPVTAAPVALYALAGGYWEAAGDGLTNGTGNFVGVNRAERHTLAEYFGVRAPISSGYGGMYITTDGAAGQPFYGYAADNRVAWTYLDGASGDWRLHLGGATRFMVNDDGAVGIGIATPTAKVDVRTNNGDGMRVESTGASSIGVLAYGLEAGVRGECGRTDGAGVFGSNAATGGIGVRGSAISSSGAAVAGFSNLGTGVYGQTSTGYAVYGSNGGSSSSGYAGYFNGRVHVAGTLSKSGGSFKIDHPLDPANKYLSHSFVESPEMLNIYNGTVVLDAQGRAAVTLPDWFEALNGDFRYQLTPIGGAAPNLHIAAEVRDNRFEVAGGAAGLKVSWQVTGVRRDAWAEANRIPVEEEKPDGERGLYLHPELFGAPADAQIDLPAVQRHAGNME